METRQVVSTAMESDFCMSGDGTTVACTWACDGHTSVYAIKPNHHGVRFKSEFGIRGSSPSSADLSHDGSLLALWLGGDCCGEPPDGIEVYDTAAREGESIGAPRGRYENLLCCLREATLNWCHFVGTSTRLVCGSKEDCAVWVVDARSGTRLITIPNFSITGRSPNGRLLAGVISTERHRMILQHSQNPDPEIDSQNPDPEMDPPAITVFSVARDNDTDRDPAVVVGHVRVSYAWFGGSKSQRASPVTNDGTRVVLQTSDRRLVVCAVGAHLTTLDILAVISPSDAFPNISDVGHASSTTWNHAGTRLATHNVLLDVSELPTVPQEAASAGRYRRAPPPARLVAKLDAPSYLGVDLRFSADDSILFFQRTCFEARLMVEAKRQPQPPQSLSGAVPIGVSYDPLDFLDE